MLTLILGLLLFVDLVVVLELHGARQTVMNPAFIESELKRVDIYGIAKGEIDKQKDEFLADLGPEGERFFKVIDQSLSEDWLNSQVSGMVRKFYSYLRGESEDINLSIPLADMKSNLKASLRESVYEDRPEGLQALSTQELDEYLLLAYEGVDDLPQEIGIQFGSLEGLKQIRNMLRGLDLVFYVLILAAVLFALLLAFLHLRVRSIARVLGIPLFLSGVVVIVVSQIAPGLISGPIAGMDLPSAISTDTVLTVVKDFLTGANVLAIVFIAIGAVLIAFSFLYTGQRKPPPIPPPPRLSR